MKKPYILILASLFLLVPLTAVSENAKIGTYTLVEGRVDCLHEGALKTIPININEPVFLGDIVRTKSSSKVEITFFDESILRLAPSSRVAIEEYMFDKMNKREGASLKLFRGKIRATVSKNGDTANFHIDTPNAKGLVKGTDIFASYEADATSVLVKEGKMSIYNPSSPQDIVEVTKGDYINVPAEKAPLGRRAYLDAEISRDEEETTPALILKERLKEEELVKMKGKLTAFMGEVRIYKFNENKWRPVKLGEELTEGDKLETGEKSRLTITLENGNTLFLQEKSEILIRTLKQDPKTGEFENLFESESGKIKAIVEKLGKKSTFRVKTPIAVCGVRGTVMYLDIQPTQTMAFYEGGQGEVMSLITGQAQLVDAGQNLAVDMQGNVSAPIATNDNQRMTIEEKWESKQSVDKYAGKEEETTRETAKEIKKISAPPSAKEAPITNLIERAEINKIETRILERVRFEEVASKVVPKEAVSFSGHFGFLSAGRDSNSVDFNMDSSSSVSGNFAFSIPGIGSRWGGTSTKGNTLSGTYSGQSDYKLWGIAMNSADSVYTASDGGKMGGFIGGTMIDGRLAGKTFGMYVDSYNYAGTYSGLFTGTSSRGSFESSGDVEVKFTPRGKVSFGPGEMRSEPVEEGDILNGKGSGNFIGAFIGGEAGTIEADAADGHHINFTGKHWGIWAIAAEGSYTDYASEEWKLALGGSSDRSNSSADTNAWLGTVEGNQWRDDSLKGTFEGFWFSESGTSGKVNAGRIFNGDIIGYYDDEAFTWEAIGGGEWIEVTNLLSEADLGFTISEFENFVTVPITEAYSSLVAANTSHFTNVSMDINFYQNALNQIWAGSVSGGHSGGIDNNWTLSLSNDSNHSVTLTGDRWSDGQWHAVVQGAMPDNNVTFSGEAAGTYNSSSFEGVGGGKWQENT